ncbi:galactosylceramide sulfotransferase-like [Haliotis rufescens]|uniref:galactosylceramide sulfotransferase-like n=1 Tax=Haliotis rufescens TaxID=6454 RepID=UPI00201ECC3E|nr:galactosylceramide sulfotransferase-like [Haliotis rufescens]
MRSNLRFVVILACVMLLLWISLNTSVFLQNQRPDTIPCRLPITHTPESHSKSACTVVTHVAFLKVHKAGSSTVANIIQRFGIQRNLSFVVPKKPFHGLSYNYIGGARDTVSRDNVIPPPAGTTYDVLWNHVVYNRSAFKNVMPADTRYISIVRHPMDQFVSAFEYYGPGQHVTDAFWGLKDHQSIVNGFLDNPWDFEDKDVVMSHTLNSLAYDFGFTDEMIQNKTSRFLYLTQMAEDFQLVMVMEHFDESLVLLKRYFCWSTKDILYLPKNKNEKKKRLTFTDKYRERHRQVAETDYDIYAYFRSLFWRKVWEEGPSFHSEVAHFKYVNSVVTDHCLLNKTLHVAASPWDEPYTVNWMDCHYINSNELDLYDVIYNSTVGRTQQ